VTVDTGTSIFGPFNRVEWVQAHLDVHIHQSSHGIVTILVLIRGSAVFHATPWKCLTILCRDDRPQDSHLASPHRGFSLVRTKILWYSMRVGDHGLRDPVSKFFTEGFIQPDFVDGYEFNKPDDLANAMLRIPNAVEMTSAKSSKKDSSPLKTEFLSQRHAIAISKHPQDNVVISLECWSRPHNMESSHCVHRSSLSCGSLWLKC
jgi:hypothetical protein